MLEKLKVSLIPEKIEIVHEHEKGNSPRGIVKLNWDCNESFYVLGISLLWLESQGTNPENVANARKSFSSQFLLMFHLIEIIQNTSLI